MSVRETSRDILIKDFTDLIASSPDRWRMIFYSKNFQYFFDRLGIVKDHTVLRFYLCMHARHLSTSILKRHANLLDSAYVGQEEQGEFVPKMVALILDEAPMGGCGLLLRRDKEMKIGDRYKVKLGPLAPYWAQIKWIRDVDEELVRIGFEFLE